MKEKLITAILDLSGDEFETKDEVVSLSKETNEQLVDRLIHIAKWYQDEYNND